MLFDLVCSDKQIIILDDMERTGPGFDDNAVFGSVNDLVEGRGMKVVIVTNDIAKVNAKAREKKIWKVFDFSPTPGNWRVTCLGPWRPSFPVVLSLT